MMTVHIRPHLYPLIEPIAGVADLSSVTVIVSGQLDYYVVKVNTVPDKSCAVVVL